MTGTIITGAHLTGVILNNPATENPATIAASGTVSNTGTALLGAAGTAWTVTNLGTIEGTGTLGFGIDLLSGGSVTNGSHATTKALIEGGYIAIIVDGAAGRVANYGTIIATGGVPGAGPPAVFLASGGSIVNSGFVRTNENGLWIQGSPGRVVNAGTVVSIGAAAGSGSMIRLNVPLRTRPAD